MYPYGYSDSVGDEVGFGFISDAVKSVGKAVKSVVKSPVLKVAATGLSFVAPPVGVPALVGLTAADKVISAAEGRSTPAKRQSAFQIIRATVAAARAGDRDAVGGVKLLQQAKQRARAKPRPRPRPAVPAAPLLEGYLVTSRGQIIRGRFRRA